MPLNYRPEKDPFAIFLASIFVVFIFLGIFPDVGRSNTHKESSIETKIVEKVTLSQAQAFMQNRCDNIGQTLMRTKTIDFDGTTMYAFMSVAENGMVCVSTISEHKLEVLASDCGEAQMKINQWNNF